MGRSSFKCSWTGTPLARHIGLDVDADGRGVLQDGRLYQLVRQDGAIQDVQLEIRFLQAGAEAYVFTCG